MQSGRGPGFSELSDATRKQTQLPRLLQPGDNLGACFASRMEARGARLRAQVSRK